MLSVGEFHSSAELAPAVWIRDSTRSRAVVPQPSRVLRSRWPANAGPFCLRSFPNRTLGTLVPAGAAIASQASAQAQRRSPPIGHLGDEARYASPITGLPRGRRHGHDPWFDSPRPAPGLARDAFSVGSRPLPVSVFAAEVTCPLTPPPLTAVNGANRLWLASIVSRHLTRWHEPDEYRPL